MENKKYMVNKSLMVMGLVYFVFLVFISVILLTMSDYIAAAVFFLVSIPFGFIAFRYGSTVTFLEDTVVLDFLGIKRKEIKWKKVKEVSVCGTRVLNRLNKDKCGTVYIIFSEKRMNEKERVDMMLKWPPKGKIYLKFEKDRLMALQMKWQKPVQKFNIGTLEI